MTNELKAQPSGVVLSDEELWSIRNQVAINEVLRDDDSVKICVKHGRAIEQAVIARLNQPASAGDDRETIRAVFLRNGFTIKEGQADLKPYVYAAADELMSIARASLSAPSHGEQVRGLPECVRAWFEAKKAHVKAVGDYNARLAFVKQHMPFGTSVDPEYQIMEAADRKVRDLVWPMFVGLMEIAAPSPASHKEQGE